MNKHLRKIFFSGLIGFLILIMTITIFEHTHSLQHYEEFVGTSTQQDRLSYTVTDRASHLGYLQTFAYQGQQVRYLDRGDIQGPVLVFLHGTPTNSWLYRKTIPGLIDAGYRVIVPDMLGFGASSMPTHAADISTARQSSTLLALLEHLDIETFSLAAHDQGSLWMRETVTQHPEKIDHMIVFNSIADRDGFHPPAGFGKENIGTTFTAWAMGSKPLGRIFAYGAMLGGLKNKRHATTTMIDGYLFPLLNGMSNTYHSFITNFDDIHTDLENHQQLFPELDIPTLVLRGIHDKILVGNEQVPVLQDLLSIPDEDIHFLEAAHFVQEEVPDEIVEKIDAFIKK